jgi:transcriptional regulator with XRE-family HTH domain
MVDKTLNPASLRARTGFTQLEIAARVGRCLSAVTKWENRGYFPAISPRQLETFCRAYDCNVLELIEASEKPPEKLKENAHSTPVATGEEQVFSRIA